LAGQLTAEISRNLLRLLPVTGRVVSPSSDGGDRQLERIYRRRALARSHPVDAKKGDEMKPRVELAVAVLAGAVLFVSAPAAAAGPTKTLKQQLIGTWTMVSDTFEGGGNKIEVFGPHPKGAMILAGDGHFSVVITRGDVARFASDSRMKGTAEENTAAVQGSIGYFGTYTVSEADKTLLLHVESCTFPNWSGTDQKRIVEIEGDELRAVNPTPAVGSGTARVVWKRAKVDRPAKPASR
jgi:lipocalin-like protein